MIDVSIIVPAYNHESYIKETVMSLVSQKTDYTYEILIGDDASTDATGRIIAEMAGVYPGLIRVVRHKKNVGATKNGYSLVKAAKGRYLSFCDGDDQWCDEERLQRHIDFLEINPSFAGICGRIQLMDESGNMLREDTIGERSMFWNSRREVYSKEHFEQWEMPGHICALTIRNFMRMEEHDFRIFYKAHGTVGDRTIVLLTVLQGLIKCEPDCVGKYRYRVNQQDNFMSRFDQENLYGKDFLMIRRLEQYADREFGIQINAEGIKKDRLAATVVKAMKDNCPENRRVLRQIIACSEAPWRYLMYACKVLVLKWVYWNILKTDRRIRL